ncbi:hypothetical protein T265_07517 [Opisthorchis viverrini]|uniref:Reverse transcriptase domain-containing protein n=1 Tax=Opisthorchis viverrini TaxID=6198 RepID=A0A074ZNP6_OPIVI|nr:hypothetical protein T265_07517 [Opisthorchis viverrini]KER24955.1 hypothetical protein T265_07517 [Opisthorchis viverrini]
MQLFTPLTNRLWLIDVAFSYTPNYVTYQESTNGSDVITSNPPQEAVQQLVLRRHKRPLIKCVNEAPLVELENADDIFEGEEKVQVFSDELTKVILSFGMHFAPTKCKVMFLDVQLLNTPLTIQGEVLKIVERFTYLGSCISSDCSVRDEVNARICKARVAFANLRTYGVRYQMDFQKLADWPATPITRHNKRLKMTQWLEHEFTDRKVRGSNPSSALRLHMYRLEEPGSILTHVLPLGGMAVRHRKCVTAERLVLPSLHNTTLVMTSVFNTSLPHFRRAIESLIVKK